MPLEIISPENKEIEDNIQKELYDHIDKGESVIFNSGAGAGKTYALVECLKYIVQKHGDRLNEHNQKVICITYTNVATNHIKERLGNSELVRVSTIHERVWEFIQRHQKQLVEIHTAKVRSELEILKEKCSNEEDYSFFTNLSDLEKQEFKNVMFENKEAFYEAYGLSASAFRNAMPKRIAELCKGISNVGKFKSLVSMIYKIRRYEDCLEDIAAGKYKKVEYNALYNEDRLDRMLISHDTVLEYGLKMVEKYPRLRQIIIDQYPYFMVDEYQDTSENVVKILNLLDKSNAKVMIFVTAFYVIAVSIICLELKEIGHDVFVAYFGDSVQSIYEDGVGNQVKILHEGLTDVTKIFNRRSYKEVIDVANRIRNDEIVQESIYTDCEGGSVEFIHGSKDKIDEIIRNCVNEWNINIDNPLHCLFTLNKTVAERSEFAEMYTIFETSSAYSGANRNQLTTEVLSDDPAKLGPVPNLLRRLMLLYLGLKDSLTPLRTILVSEEIYKVNIEELRELINSLKNREGTTLDELFISVFQEYENQKDSKYSELIDLIFGLEDMSHTGVKNYIQEKLYKNEQDEEKIRNGMQSLLNLNIEVLENWYRYITLKKKDTRAVVNHTYHGTKGLEFENVIIIMEKDFGRNRKEFFQFFFENYGCKEELSEKDALKFEYAKNLIYVATTRAIKNLKVYYVDDVSSIKSNVEGIFGEMK